MKALARLAAFCLLFSASLAFSQSSAKPKEFEVATIKPSAPLDPAKIAAQVQAGRMPRLGPFVDASHAEYTYMPLKALIATAYDLKYYQVSGPAWMETEYFDIVAKMPEGATKDDALAMLRALLEERFKLVARRETQEHKVLALVIGKNGPKLKVSPPDPVLDEAAPLKSGEIQLKGDDGSMRITKNPDGSTTINTGSKGIVTQRIDTQEQVIHFESSKITMAGFADMLTSILRMGGGQGLQVVDQTGLKGNYQVSFDRSLADLVATARAQGVMVPPEASVTSDPAQPAAPGGGSTIYASVEKLGLKLEERKLPVEQLVVDHIEKTPTEN